MESHQTTPHHHRTPSFKSSHNNTQLELYTIPTQSCWFSWDSIHDTERSELREFFDNSSFTRSIKIYKEYRDFIISKYREDCSRRLTFTEVRKSLVGDVCVLRKVFNFLDKWGLINFSATTPPPPPIEAALGDGDGDGVRVKVEEGPPFGVRVIAAPGSLKPIVVPVLGAGVKPVTPLPLASYNDVFRKVEVVSCGNCKDKCDSKYYQCTKEKYLICVKCYEKGEFGEKKVKEDFKINHIIEISRDQESVWTEAETLLLLESVLKHGDDWELVAQNVQTKTKHECISRLIELPLGEIILGSRDKFSSKAGTDESDAAVRDQNASISTGPSVTPGLRTSSPVVHDSKFLAGPSQLQEPARGAGPEDIATQDQKASSESRDDTMMKDSCPQATIDNHQKKIIDGHQQENAEMENCGDIEHLEPPLKKSRIGDSDPNRSLIDQVALISTMVSPQITAAAASAAVTVLSDGNPLVRDIFYVDDHVPTGEQKPGNLNLEMERDITSEDTEMKDASHSSEMDNIFSMRESIPLALQTRAAVGTALGAAAAHARLLADHEEKQIELLVAFLIETQLKKVERKVKLFEDVENLMQKEHKVLEESKDLIIGQRLDILQRIIGEGIPRLRDSNSLRPASQ